VLVGLPSDPRGWPCQVEIAFVRRRRCGTPTTRRGLAIGRFEFECPLDGLHNIVHVHGAWVARLLANCAEAQADRFELQRVRRLANDCFGDEWDEVITVRARPRRPIFRDGVIERIAFERSKRAQQDESPGCRCRGDQVVHTARCSIERFERVVRSVWQSADHRVDAGSSARGAFAVTRIIPKNGHLVLEPQRLGQWLSEDVCQSGEKNAHS